MRCATQKGSTVPWRQGVLVPILISGFAAIAQGQQKPIIKHVPVVDTDPSSGQEMFNTFCAVCHGADARGNGPAVPALKKTPGDLTQLTKNAGGKFPELRVYEVIRGDVGVTAHGSKDMPVWGQVFRRMSGSQQQTHMRLSNLTRYIASIQR